MKMISIKKIDLPVNSLRGPVTLDSEVQAFINSIGDHGMDMPITVRPKGDRYELLDGVQRHRAAITLGLKELPAIVRDIADEDVIFFQIRANEQRLSTKPSELRAALLHILKTAPDLSEPALAVRLNKSRPWVRTHLELTKIVDPLLIHKLDTGALPLTPAFYIGKLPESEHKHYATIAESEPVAVSVPIICARVKELKEQGIKEYVPEGPVFKPVPIIKNRKELMNALDKPESISIVSKGKVDIVREVLEWMFNLDARGIEEQQRKFQKRSDHISKIK